MRDSLVLLSFLFVQMAEKWDDSANDSPEVVYEGFSPPPPPPPTHPQVMINAASSSFVSADGNDDGTLGAQQGGYMPTGPMVEEQVVTHPMHGEGSHHEEIERTRLCFVCCNPVSDKNFESIKTSMNHSHAPLLVLLTDVLGYKLEDGRLHSQVVCKACYHLLDIIDELQQTLTESKTDVRTKFLETVQKLKLKYPRTDKMLKPRCLRCIQMSQTSARKRGRGRGWKSRSEELNRGRGRGRGRGRARSRSEDGHDPGSDNDNEGQGFCHEEIKQNALPSKSHLPQTCQDNSKREGSPVLDLSDAQPKSSPTSNHCIWNSKDGITDWNTISDSHVTDEHSFCPDDKERDHNSVLSESFHNWIGHTSDLMNTKIEEYTNKECECCIDMNYYDCLLCKQSDSKVFYQHCEKCLMCQGVFIPWGNNVSLEFIGGQCAIWKIQAKNCGQGENLHIVNYGSMLLGDECKVETVFDKFPTLALMEKSSVTKTLEEDLFNCAAETQADVPLLLPCLRNESLASEYDHFSVKKELHKINHDKETEGGDSEVNNLYINKLSTRSPVTLPSDNDENESLFVQNEMFTKENTIIAETDNRTSDDIIPVLKSNSSDSMLMPKTVVVAENSEDVTVESVTCIMHEVDESSDVDHSYIEVSETMNIASEMHTKHSKREADVTQNRPEASQKENEQKYLPENKSESELEKKTLSDVFTDISTQPCLGKRRRKPTTKVKELLVEDEPNQSGTTSARAEKKIKGFQNENSNKDPVEIEENPSTPLNDKGKSRDCRYICEFCGKKFNSIGGFRYHVDGHEASVARVFTCYICSYKTRRKADLRKHMVIHTGEKQYKCEVCGQEFSVNSSYTRHMRIHSGEKPYKCDTCGKDFRSGGTLKQHMVKHTGARNFVCEVCGSSFSLRHHYTAHWKLHSGDMPIKCKVCSISFRNYSALRHHRKKNHPKEEAHRLKNLKMKMVRVDKVKIKPRPKVIEHSIDVLQQAMAAAVETVTCECVDSYTQTLPVNAGTSDAVVSKMIANNLTSKDSVVLAITDLQEEEIEKVDSPKFIHHTLSNELDNQIHTSIVHSVEVDDDAVTLGESAEKGAAHHANESSLHSSFYNDDGIDSTRDFIVVNSEGEPMPDLKPENVKVVQASNEDTSPMYIVLSDIQAQDSQLYIVLDKDTHVSG
ncbi:uncharacterized protein LOC122246398 isoform X3 [Penaeus japonicus]|uniref:uncharacterized protein LOC122246398 isoform X3 n=1 Tax=Penaeus japonicus TaxID=27405 RepID=UPI001C713845|nr:uncharacterized protein LOC122246398 isoform X3 [Penaeus japonicus]